MKKGLIEISLRFCCVLWDLGGEVGWGGGGRLLYSVSNKWRSQICHPLLRKILQSRSVFSSDVSSQAKRKMVSSVKCVIKCKIRNALGHGNSHSVPFDMEMCVCVCACVYVWVLCHTVHWQYKMITYFGNSRLMNKRLSHTTLWCS